MSLTLKAYISGVREGRIDAKATVFSYLEKAKTDDVYNAFVRLHPDYVEQHIATLIALPLAGAPIGIKDIFMTKGYETTCCSKILQGYIPEYSSTVFDKLAAA
jgi:aspartyl-tRNA(Asn)/glutamyl-tRNA(Gln) amidotransferase subunit A